MKSYDKNSRKIVKFQVGTCCDNNTDLNSDSSSADIESKISKFVSAIDFNSKAVSLEDIAKLIDCDFNFLFYSVAETRQLSYILSKLHKDCSEESVQTELSET